jgi:hypothetical protein
VRQNSCIPEVTRSNSSRAITPGFARSLIRTSAVSEHKIREPPDVSQSDSIVEARQDEFQLAGPSTTLLHVAATTASGRLSERFECGNEEDQW